MKFVSVAVFEKAGMEFALLKIGSNKQTVPKGTIRECGLVKGHVGKCHVLE
jgi:hypothetical protein